MDYLFKRIFGNDDDKSRLISLVNAIFANKNIDRIVADIILINSALEKHNESDKFSIIDIMATLSSGSRVCIEMHLYGLLEFKYKSLRTWARVYGEGLRESQKFRENKPVICISFLDGALVDADGERLKAVHTLFQVRERDGHELLLTDMELHYINMRAFVEEHCDRAVPPDMFTKWLTLITQSEQRDKEYLKKICDEDEEIAMTVELIASLTEDQATRLAYLRRKDQMASYYAAIRQTEEYRKEIDDMRRRAEESNRRAEESNRRVIKAMRAKNWTTADIAEALELPEEEIEKSLGNPD